MFGFDIFLKVRERCVEKKMRVEIVFLEDIKEFVGKFNDIYMVNRLVKIISFILVVVI